MSHEISKSVESEGQRPFRVEVGSLENLEDIYCVLGHTIQMGPANQIIKIGTSHSEDELFSQINVNAITYEGYSISADLSYQNPNHQYWTNEQVEQLKKLLTNDYEYNSIDHKIEEGIHSLIVKDPDMELSYALNLGFEDQKTAWTNQVKEFNKLLTELNKDHPQYSSIHTKIKEILNHLTASLNPISTDSTIIIKPIDADPFPSPIAGLADDPQEISAFKKTTETWAGFVEKAVNAMAKIKGIPQSGKITLLPPYAIPQS